MQASDFKKDMRVKDHRGHEGTVISVCCSAVRVQFDADPLGSCQLFFNELDMLRPTEEIKDVHIQEGNASSGQEVRPVRRRGRPRRNIAKEPETTNSNNSGIS